MKSITAIRESIPWSFLKREILDELATSQTETQWTVKHSLKLEGKSELPGAGASFPMRLEKSCCNLRHYITFIHGLRFKYYFKAKTIWFRLNHKLLYLSSFNDAYNIKNLTVLLSFIYSDYVACSMYLMIPKIENNIWYKCIFHWYSSITSNN